METLSDPSTALLPLLPSSGWSPGHQPWQQPTLPNAQMMEGAEKSYSSLLVHSQTLASSPRACPLLLPPIDFLVYMEPKSLCAHSLLCLASFRASQSPLVSILLPGQGHHSRHFPALAPKTLCPRFPHRACMFSKGTVIIYHPPFSPSCLLASASEGSGYGKAPFTQTGKTGQLSLAQKRTQNSR